MLELTMLHLTKKHLIGRLAALASLFLALCCVVSACSDDNTPLPEKYVTLRLKINPGVAQSLSRASAPDRYDPSEGDYENVNTLRIIITRPGDSGTRIVLANRLVATSSNGYPTEKLEFKVLGNYEYRVLLIANEDYLTPPRNSGFTTVRSFLDSFEEKRTFNQTLLLGWTVAAPAVAPNITGNIFADGMPMAEWFDIAPLVTREVSNDEPSVREENTVDVHLFLTRVACKVTYNVNVSEEYKAKGVSVTGIRLENIDQSQYVFPHDAVYEPAKVSTNLPVMDDNTGSFVVTNRYISSFTVPSNNTLLNYPVNLPADKYVPVQKGSKATIGPYYFPETKFTDSQTNFKVSVRLSDSSEWLPAQSLTNNILMMKHNIQGIARNTHLIVNINFDGTGITWNAVVAPYNEVSLLPEFGL